MASQYDWLPGRMPTQDDGSGHISAAVVTPVVGGRRLDVREYCVTGLNSE